MSENDARPYLAEITRGRFVALLRNLDDPMVQKIVPVPEGQSLEFDEGSATRQWLLPHLGREWHLLSFHEIGFYSEDCNLVAELQFEIAWLSRKVAGQ